MKKSLIALAVLATTGAAIAQSNVTIYGRIDTSIGASKKGTTRTTQVFSDNLTTSRYGFRGTEDLGGGLKANFQLENGFKSDDGTASSTFKYNSTTPADSTVTGTAFSRQSWVGLSGGFGALKLGKTDVVYKDVFDIGNSSNVFDSKFTTGEIAYTVGFGSFSSRPGNQIRYETPNFSGFSAGVSFVFDETAGVKNDSTGLSLRYKAGPLDAGFGYLEQKNSVPANDLEFTVLAGAYDFGVARVSAQFQNTKAGDGRKDRDYGIGVAVPLGAFTVSAGYGKGDAKSTVGVKTNEGTGFAVAATYSLSKRTTAYAGYLDGNTKVVASGAKTDTSLYAVGLRHDF